MQLLFPWGLLGLLLVPAAVLLHVFRAPGRKHEVSWLRLWQKVLARVRPESTQRLKRFDWLLILEILVIILLVLGISRPVIWRERPRRHVSFIIDTSASMKTVDADGRSRWEKALEKIRYVLARLSEDDLVSFLGGLTPVAAWDASPGEAASKLDEFRVNDGAIEAVKLLETGLRGVGSSPGVVYLVTDNPPAKTAGIPSDRLRLITVGGPSRNVGIIALSGSPGRNGTCKVFVRVGNFADAPANRRLAVVDASETRKQFDVELPAGGTVEKVFDVHLTPAHPAVRVELQGADDGFPVDDRCDAVLRPLWVVAVAGTVNPAYSRLFGGSVFEGTVYVETDDLQPGGIPRDALLIAEGVIPKGLGRTTVLVNPPTGEAAGIGIGNEEHLEQPTAPVAVSEDPLMRSVNLTGLKLDRCRALTLPETARPLMRLGTRVVAAAVEFAGGRVVVLGFDVKRAGWQLQPSFVVFWANVLADAKKRSGAGGLIHHRTGEIVRLPLGRERAELSAPGGKRGVVPDADGWGIVPASRAGLYEWRAPGRSGVFAVNLLSETESDNRPAPAAEATLDLPIPASTGKATPLGPWLCLLAAALTALWWQFRR